MTNDTTVTGLVVPAGQCRVAVHFRPAPTRYHHSVETTSAVEDVFIGSMHSYSKYCHLTHGQGMLTQLPIEQRQGDRDVFIWSTEYLVTALCLSATNLPCMYVMVSDKQLWKNSCIKVTPSWCHPPIHR
jgi:hypothetical protein